jgi:hypothetical protein
MLEGLSLGSYLLLVDYTGRLFRDGTTPLSAELAGILERLGSDSERWWSRIEKLSKGGLLGRFLRQVENASGMAPHTWACTTWQSWADARRANRFP